MRSFIFSAALFVVSAVPSFAATIEVEMLNKNDAGDRMVFSQELIRAEIGDVRGGPSFPTILQPC